MAKDMQSTFSIAATLLLVTFPFVLFMAGARLSNAGESMTPAETEIRQLNDQYIEAFLKADVGWYEKHLANDFLCIESNGGLLDKHGFLQGARNGPDVADYRLDQVRVRIYGNTALVQGTGLFTRKDGSSGKSRYIDIYILNGKQWKVVSAQITRVTSPDQ